MDYFLHRCSGTTFCHYAKRFQRGCFSFLAYHGFLPEVLSKEVPVTRTIRTRRYSATNNSIRFLSFRPTLTHAQVRSIHNLHSIRNRSVEIPAPVQECLDSLNIRVHAALCPEPELVRDGLPKEFEPMVHHYFRKGGKLIRPTCALLMAGTCNPAIADSEDLLESQKKVAVISEMIHTASLVHDDVIDESDLRRNSPTVHSIWGNKKAILIGDYILARATQLLCSIGDPQIISILAQVIEDLVKGEFMQLGDRDTMEERFAHYIRKTFKKTGSLFAHSCKAVAALAPESTLQIRDAAFEYGRSLGMAFQLIDDVLDFVSESRDQTGKPVAADMKLGLATAPVIFASRRFPRLEILIKRRFCESGDVEEAWDLVGRSDGVEEARQLAQTYSNQALRQLQNLPVSNYSKALEQLALLQMERNS